MCHEYSNHFPSLALKRIITLKKKKKHNWKPNSYFAAEFEEGFKRARGNLQGLGRGGRSDGSGFWSLESLLLYSISACSVIMRGTC